MILLFPCLQDGPTTPIDGGLKRSSADMYAEIQSVVLNSVSSLDRKKYSTPLAWALRAMQLVLQT